MIIRIIIILFWLLLLDEIAFILFNISGYVYFCGLEFSFLIYLKYIYLYVNINLILYLELNIINLIYNLNIFNINIFVLYINNIDNYNQLIDYNYFSAHLNLINNNIFLIHINGLISENINNIFFYVLQNKIYILPGETILIFFRLLNYTNINYIGFALYLLYPQEYLIYFNKLQCFCFEEFKVNSGECLNLPILFYLDNNILYNINIIKEIYLEYILLLNINK